MAGLNETSNGNRIHIGIFGRTNSGKSSFINAFTGQQVSIVSDIKGTTTDPVYKAMEVHPLGPCTIIDTAGFDDDTELGELRLEKSKLAADKSDIGIVVISTDNCDYEVEKEWVEYLKEKNIPVLMVLNKIDLIADQESIIQKKLSVESAFSTDTICVSTETKQGIDLVIPMITRILPESYGYDTITGNLCEKGDLVLLIMPQDIQAPKGRLILPQVQVLRELLDKKCHAVCATTDEMVEVLDDLKQPPKLIITDSQVFSYVYEHKPKESLLTSFSVLMAACKGDIEYYVDGAEAINKLTENSKVLIAECCTHAPLSEDIGREKIPALLRKRIGQELKIEMVSGTDFPEDLSSYDLIIQCGACMFNKKHVISRIDKAKAQKVSMTNYGVCIAALTGILNKVVFP